MTFSVDEPTWRKRWVKVRGEKAALVAENRTLRQALDDLNEDVEELLSDAAHNGVETAKSHTIRQQRRVIARLRDLLRTHGIDHRVESGKSNAPSSEMFDGTRAALDRLTVVRA